LPDEFLCLSNVPISLGEMPAPCIKDRFAVEHDNGGLESLRDLYEWRTRPACCGQGYIRVSQSFFIALPPTVPLILTLIVDMIMSQGARVVLRTGRNKEPRGSGASSGSMMRAY